MTTPIGNSDNIINFTQKLGPTIGGKKPLLGLSNEDKKKILQDIKKDWQTLIDLHFEYEAGISDDRTYPWKSLSHKHQQYKERNDFSDNILEMNTPSLATRYKQSIKINPKTFSITMGYPELIGMKRRRPQPPVTAIVHQKREVPGRVIRRIILKDFQTIVKNKTLEYLTQA